MKKTLFLIILTLFWQINAYAVDLLQVYREAAANDTLFQQAVSKRLATKEGVPISFAALLPNISVNANPAVTRYGYSGSNFTKTSSSTSGFIYPRNETQRSYNLNLSISQTIFDFAQFATVANSLALSKEADATLNAALQDLMVRVANAYFTILKDEDNVVYSMAAKRAYAQQLDQINEQYKVGLKTITDVYTAQASYDSAIATLIAAETQLNIDKENLRVITGSYYKHFSPLSPSFILVSPSPKNMDTWVKIALQQNWSIKASRYDADASRQLIKKQFAGHLPTVNVEGSFSRQYVNNINSYQSFDERQGPGTTSEKQVMVNINMPIFAGGGVAASTKQAIYQYNIAEEQLEQTTRNIVNNTRQNYLSVMAGISQVKADFEAVKSNRSTLQGFIESYRAGTETLVNVLNQQQKVFEAETQYATDRYAYINHYLALKQAAGILSFSDLQALNRWLK